MIDTSIIIGRSRFLFATAGAAVLLASIACAPAADQPDPPASAANRTSSHAVVVNVIGTSASEVLIANADGSGERSLLVDPKKEYNASFSADGQWIVFTSERDGPANIYRVRSDGSGIERLTNHDGFDDQAALSPDGRQLAFVSTRDGGTANIGILDLASKQVRNLTAAIPTAADQRRSFVRPAWSPDGRWIAFSSDYGTSFEDHQFPKPGWEHIQRSSVYIIGSDGSGLRRISDGREYAGSPKWSADGKQIVIYSLSAEQTFAVRNAAGERIDKVAPTDSQVFTLDVATGARRQRTDGPGLKISPEFVGRDRIGYVMRAGLEGKLAFADDPTVVERYREIKPDHVRNPDWSADGHSVVYHRNRYALRQGQPLYAPTREFALRFSAEFPAVSASGRIAVTPFPHDSAGMNAVFGGHSPGVPVQLPGVPLQLVDVDGSNTQKIFERPGYVAMSPTWSPDGRQLVFTQTVMKPGEPSQLVMVNADGTGVRELTRTATLSNSFPSWSPDGSSIVYRVRREGELGLRILTLKDGSVRKLTLQKDAFPFWSPDGSRICFTRETGGIQSFDIFTIRPDGTDLQQLTSAPGNDAHCTWSTDSRWILFSSSRLGYRDEAALEDPGFAQPYSELFVMNANGTGQRAITDDRWEQGTPAWVPEEMRP